ncbi:hypothetical protein EJ04DRAFT_507157 [Polyplosphaeria fusca]|uniref:Altered inheritance of mitochondria protein 11 n=1 Tax=Polyplosphaeria fusca TaxID=682080 RepID=A0A9P4R972_9PLEO|nr:hypothetical protein EJ04DRAFT_507157 [Polyplosphaeria fusca]
MGRPPTVPTSPSSSSNPPQTRPESAYESTPVTSARSLRQLSIFFLGATCFLASAAVTRRAVHRRQLRLKPKFYEPNTNPHEHFSPMLDAMQALNLATMNVFSVGFMLVGGALWSVDISSLQEMRAGLRGRLGYESFNELPQDGAASAQPPQSTTTTNKSERHENRNTGTPR